MKRRTYYGLVTGSDIHEDSQPVHLYHLFSGDFCSGGCDPSEKVRRQKSYVTVFMTLPLVLPPTVAGFFLLYLFGVKRPVGQFFIDFFGVKIAFSWGATVLAAVVMSFPLMYRSARGAFEQVDPDLTAAARTLGMSEWEIFWKVLFANATPGILSGGVLAFARGLGEFGATSMIAGNIAGKTRTLPMAVYSEVAAGNMGAADRYVAVIVVIAFISILLMNLGALRAGGRKHGA